MEKVILIEKQVESAEERKYRVAYKALFDAKQPDYYKPDFLVAFADAGCICAGHSVEVLDVGVSETFVVEIRPRSEVPLVKALYGRQIAEMVPVIVQSQCTNYKVLNVRVTINSSVSSTRSDK